MLSALASLSAIKNILVSKISQESMDEITPTILKLVNSALIDENITVLENCLGFLNIILYKSNNLNDDLMHYFPVLCYIIIGRPNE